MASPASTPLYTLEGLRAADPLLALALLILVAVVFAEGLYRAWRLPRACGQMLMGALAGPLLLRLLERSELDAWKPLVDLAIGAVVFELGSRIRPRWLLDNRAMALSCIAQAAGCALFSTFALLALGAPLLSAAVAGAVAASTSPVVTLAVVHETGARGQVTERLLLMTVVNSVLAVLVLKALRIGLAFDAPPAEAGAFTALLRSALIIAGSLLLGVACGFLLERLSPWMRGTPAMPVVQIAIVILASLLAAHWTLSPLLTLLIAGMTARWRLAHHLTVEPLLGSAGAVLNVLLFVSLGLLFSLDGFFQVWPWALAIVAARWLASALALAAFARGSGLGWRQAAGLTVALQPMSSLAVLLAADSYGWSNQLGGIDARTLQALLVATMLMQFSGPLWAQWGLQRIARECEIQPKPGPG
jgi:Kef-type K+ transport system membrane component KefB